MYLQSLLVLKPHETFPCAKLIVKTRLSRSAIAEGPRDALSQLNSCQALHKDKSKELRYRRGTARRAMLGNSCYISQRMAVRTE